MKENEELQQAVQDAATQVTGAELQELQRQVSDALRQEKHIRGILSDFAKTKNLAKAIEQAEALPAMWMVHCVNRLREDNNTPEVNTDPALAEWAFKYRALFGFASPR
jgi:predicted metal-dependent HD superfamily phosphohydrolase